MAVIYYISPVFLLQHVDIVNLLGTMVAPPGSLAVSAGSLLFIVYCVGSAAVYAGLWQLGIGRPTWRIGMLFGFIQGLLAIAGLQILYSLNPNPPPIYMNGDKSFLTLVGSFVFGLLVAVVFRLITDRRRLTGE